MYPRQLVVATGNPKKGQEMVTILGATGLEILTLADFPDADQDVPETGTTYQENAALKVRAAVASTGLVCISDDGGLEIDALDGQPGLHSKRFLGEETPFPEKMQIILERMRDVPPEKRGARFRCAVAVGTPDGAIYPCEGVCEGQIGTEMRGSYGLGYDPIFLLPALGRHMAELPPEVKHPLSHRGKALAQAKIVLASLFQDIK